MNIQVQSIFSRIAGFVTQREREVRAHSVRPPIKDLVNLIEKMLGETDREYFPQTARRQILLDHINRLEERCHSSFCRRTQLGQMSRDQFAEKEKRLKGKIRDLKKRAVGG